MAAFLVWRVYSGRQSTRILGEDFLPGQLPFWQRRGQAGRRLAVAVGKLLWDGPAVGETGLDRFGRRAGACRLGLSRAAAQPTGAAEALRGLFGLLCGPYGVTAGGASSGRKEIPARRGPHPAGWGDLPAGEGLAAGAGCRHRDFYLSLPWGWVGLANSATNLTRWRIAFQRFRCCQSGVTVIALLRCRFTSMIP